MSVQSDTEMLSVSAVEEYATQNHMTVDATYDANSGKSACPSR